MGRWTMRQNERKGGTDPDVEARILALRERVARELPGVGRPGPPSRPVYSDREPDGWPSAREAAAAVGGKLRTLRTILSRPRAGRYRGRIWAYKGEPLPAAGADRGRPVRECNRPVYSDREPEGWPSARAAAAALGGKPGSLSTILARRRGTYLGRRWAYAGEPLPPLTVPARRASLRVVVDAERPNVGWPSVRECGEALGVSHETIRRRMRDGLPVAGRRVTRGPDWGKGLGNYGRRRLRRAAA